MIVLKKSRPVQNDHGDLIGLEDDDHLQYSLADGTKPFTGTVSGISPSESAHLTTKQYVDDNIAAVSGISDHEKLNNLDYASAGHIGFAQTSHIHTQYILADGTRAFSSTVSGISPTEDAHLATKGYTDDAITTATGLLTESIFTITYAAADFETTTSAAPDIAVAGPIISYVFDDTVIEELHGSLVVSENWKPSVNITSKINWMNDELQTGLNAARWKLKYHTYNDTELYSSKTYTDVAILSTLPSGCVEGYFKSSFFPYLEYNDANNPFTNGTTISFILQRDLEGEGASSYTPPAGDNVNFTFEGGYTPPEPDEVDFLFIYGDNLVGDAGLVTLVFSYETEESP